ncbi:paxillin-like isoform X5 [Carassius carassius]|uniref:paxillin-like isoform X5 n=1 Tax=Carassius carassius TaxID=217509 RepID=UPI002868A66F|nr:paxillin-like isoform X5 [Carassius carassius]
MDGETSSALAVEEIDKDFWEFDMQDFTPEAGRAKEPNLDADMSASPEKTSPDLTDFVPLSVSVAGAVDDMLDLQAISESVLVLALGMDSVTPSVQVSSLTSAPDPHPAPDSAAFKATDTHAALGTEKAHAGESLTGSVVQPTSTTDPDGTYMIPDPEWVMGGDALLADLESTASHISKQAVFLPQETPYSYPTGSDSYQDVSSPPRVASPPAQTLNGSWVEKPESKHSSTQSFSSAPKTASPRVSQSEDEHVYSFPNKQKTTDSPTAIMSSSLGSNLSELDRLLLELNAVQHSTPAFPTEETYPPKPASNAQRYVPENGVSSVVKAPPPMIEKPKRGAPGRGIEVVRPSMESMLNDLESSVPAPAPAPAVPVVPELREVQEETPTQQHARISASSATRELDELMASLSDFKVQSNIMAQGKSSPTSVPKQGNKLDNMLGSLQSDLNRLGVQTVAKGVCGACKKPIAGQVVTAMGRTWHPEHFVCTHCQEEIGSKNFFERDGQPYCEKDYHSLFSPRCYYCNGPILDRVVTALDRTWHPEHFFCAQCGSFFGPEGFHEKEGKAYCRKDYFDMFAPKCGGCARAILENYISALNALWHPECFVCRECFTTFVNGSFFEHEGQPYCEAHYHEHRGSLCSGCQKPITGRCITAMGKKFHPEHFVCAFCLKQLNKGTFKEQNDKPYCQNCFVKLFS